MVKGDPVAESGFDAVVAGLGAEAFLEVRAPHVGWQPADGFLFVNAEFRFREDPVRDIGGLDLPRPRARATGQGHGDGVGLFARGARGAPDVQLRPVFGPGAGGHLRHRLFAEEVEVRVLAKEKGMIGRDRIDQIAHLFLGVGRLEELTIRVEARGVGGAQTLPEASGDELTLLRSEINAAAFVNDAANEFEFTILHRNIPG